MIFVASTQVYAPASVCELADGQIAVIGEDAGFPVFGSGADLAAAQADFVLNSRRCLGYDRFDREAGPPWQCCLPV
jgi:hypothetical protein